MTAFSVSLEVTGMAMSITHRHSAEPQHARPDFLSGAQLVVSCGTGRGPTGARALRYAYEPRSDRYEVLKTKERRLPGTSTMGVSREVGCTHRKKTVLKYTKIITLQSPQLALGTLSILCGELESEITQIMLY